MGVRTYQSRMQFSKWYNNTSHTEYCPACNVAGRCPKRDGIESTLPTPLGFTQELDWHSRAEYYSRTPDHTFRALTVLKRTGPQKTPTPTPWGPAKSRHFLPLSQAGNGARSGSRLSPGRLSANTADICAAYRVYRVLCSHSSEPQNHPVWWGGEGGGFLPLTWGGADSPSVCCCGSVFERPWVAVGGDFLKSSSEKLGVLHKSHTPPLFNII